MKYVMREAAQIGNIFLNKGEFLCAEPCTFADKTGKRGLYRVTASGRTTVAYRWELYKYARPWFTPSDSYRILSIIVYRDAVPVCDYRERVTVSWRDLYEVEESVIRLVALANYPKWDYADVHIAGDECGGGGSYEYMRMICAKGGYKLVSFNEHGCPWFFSDTKGAAYTVSRLNSALSYIYHTVEYVTEKEGYHHESAEIASAVTESYARILLEYMGD